MPKTRKKNGRYATERQYQEEQVQNLKNKLMNGVPMVLCTLFSAGVYMSPDIYEMIEPEPVVVEARVTATPEPIATPEPTVEPTPVPVETPTAPAVEDKTEKEQIIAYIVEVFGEDAPDAFNVAYCENRNLDPYATNHNRNGSVDRGIFQLNSQYWGGEELYDWKLNIETAYMIFERAGKKWTPWTCSHRVGQTNYLGI